LKRNQKTNTGRREIEIEKEQKKESRKDTRKKERTNKEGQKGRK
jgi:hypothetical protein